MDAFQVGKIYSGWGFRLKITKRTAKKVWFDLLKDPYPDRYYNREYCFVSTWNREGEEYFRLKIFANRNMTIECKNESTNLVAYLSEEN